VQLESIQKKGVSMQRKTPLQEKAALPADVTFEKLFQNTAGHVFVKDKNGAYLAVNDEFRNAAGQDSPIIGKTDHDMPWRDSAESMIRNDREVMESGKTKTFLEKGKTGNGRLETFICEKSPLRDKQGNVIGIIGTAIMIPPDLKEKF
jgi:PAS domain S-box-containing protein